MIAVAFTVLLAAITGLCVLGALVFVVASWNELS